MTHGQAIPGVTRWSDRKGSNILVLTRNDFADGSAEQDRINLIPTPAGGPATVSDIGPADDQLTLYTRVNQENQTTPVRLGDRQSLVPTSDFSADQALRAPDLAGAAAPRGTVAILRRPGRPAIRGIMVP